MEKEITTVQAQKALDILVKYGETFYKPEYANQESMWAKVGQAISHLSDNCKGFAELLYEALEEWNWHSENAVINLMFGLSPISTHELKYAQTVLSRKNIRVREWDDKAGEYRERHANVTMTVEYLD